MHRHRFDFLQNFEKRVEQLIEFFDRFITLINDAFNNDKRFLKARDKAYKAVVNDKFVFRLEIPVNNQSIHQESKCPELLAKYCDILLQKTQLSKKLRSEEVERKLKDALLVLKYIENKDVFLRFHKIHLTRRLILDTSADYEKEENMLKWLREADVSAEYMYMNQLARMLQDIKVSEGFNQEFKGKNKDIADFINIKILSAGAWARSSNRVTVSLPLELGVSISQVELLYSSRHIGRKLQWQHQMSTGIITFDNKFDLEVTTFQMAVLFAWNPRPKDKISYESLKLATELPDTDLRRTLWSLISVPKIQRQLLLCEPDAKSAKDFNDATRFWINEEFALIKNGKVQKRGKINLVGRLQLSTEKSREEEIKGISLLRNERIKEAIVKIMKMRTRISKTALEAELKNMLCNMFTPSPKQIKQQIEWLIEHKYMERDEENINMFIYMA